MGPEGGSEVSLILPASFTTPVCSSSCLGLTFMLKRRGKAERWKGSLGMSEVYFETVSGARK